MPVVRQHLLIGTYEGLDTWITGLHTIDPNDTVTGAHDVWVAAIGELWSPGSVGNAGWASVVTPGVVATKATTYTLLPGSSKKTGKFETSLALAGTGVGDSVPPTVAAMVLLDCAGQLGRRSGRLYLPPPHTGSWANGRIDPTRFDLLRTCVQKTLLHLIAAGLRPCMVQADTGQINEVTDMRASNKCAVRKSRDDARADYLTAHVFP